MKEQFTVSANQAQDIQKQFKKWQRKAEALECEIPTITISEAAALNASKPDSRGRVSITPMVNITIEGEAPHLDQWQVIAKLNHTKFDDHYENSVTIIDTANQSASTIHQLKRDLAPACDHCEINRYRKTTFLLKHQDNDETIQIGSTCLDDFTRNASLKELNLYFNALEYVRAKSKQTLSETEYECNFVPIRDFFSLVLNIIDEEGFVSKKEAEEQGKGSTSSAVACWFTEGGQENYSERHKDTDTIFQSVEEVASQSSQFAINLSNALSRTPDFININNRLAMSIIVGAIGSAFKKMKRQKEEIKFRDEHAGIVGQRSIFTLTLIGDFIQNGDFESKHIFYFVDAKRRKFKWTCWGKEPAIEMVKNKTYEFMATVSRHDNFGVPTTVINRCKDFKLVSNELEAS